jgi:hypothetical protein
MRDLGPAVVGLCMGQQFGARLVIRERCHGSGACVRFGTHQRILTCEHVTREMRTVQRDEPYWRPVVTIRNRPYWLEPFEPLLEDAHLDIAVIAANIRPANPPPPWIPLSRPPFLRLNFPIATPKEDEMIFVMGYPRAGKEGLGYPFPGQADLREDFTTLNLQVSSASGNQCKLYPVGPRGVSFNRSKLLTLRSDLAGMSGGPAFVIRPKTEGGIQLVGLFSQGDDAEDCLFLTLTNVLTSSGEIDWGIVPHDFRQRNAMEGWS